MRELGLAATGGKRGYMPMFKEQTRRLFNATVSCTDEWDGTLADIGYRSASAARRAAHRRARRHPVTSAS